MGEASETAIVGKRHMSDKLTALGVQRISAPGSYMDGRGLMLVVRPSGSKSWVLRFQHDGRRRDYGLGGFPDLGLADAREKAAQFRKDIRAGRDVIAERRPKAEHVTFKDAAEAMLAKLMAEGRLSPRTEQGARSKLETYAYPKLGRLQLQSIDADVLAETLRPVWLRKPEAARRARQLIIRVLRFGLPNGAALENALAKAVTDRLPRQPRAENHPAMPYADIPAFLAGLKDNAGMGALALTFAILTAARSGEVRGATWGEIDPDARLWTVPASRMKMGREHRVPLTVEALALLKRVAPLRQRGSELIFASQLKPGHPVSDMTLTKVMRDAGLAYVPHGFRSSFRDWAAEQTSTDREVIEACLAHATGNEVELAYKRTDFLDKRRSLMDAWGAYCAGRSKGEVVAFPRGEPPQSGAA